MNNNEIKELIHLIDQSSLKYFELENASVSLKLSKREADQVSNAAENSKDVQSSSSQTSSNQPVTNTVESVKNDFNIKEQEETNTEDELLHVIKSPIVGTSYRSSSPDSPVFVEVGDAVKAGQTVLIIEAMKVMNEIKSDVSGVVEEILVEDGQAIEYDHALLKIKVN